MLGDFLFQNVSWGNLSSITLLLGVCVCVCEWIFLPGFKGSQKYPHYSPLPTSYYLFTLNKRMADSPHIALWIFLLTTNTQTIQTEHITSLQKQIISVSLCLFVFVAWVRHKNAIMYKQYRYFMHILLERLQKYIYCLSIIQFYSHLGLPLPCKSKLPTPQCFSLFIYL